jgi:drug/metabolite transporter (DMT)-like permease
VVRTRTDLALAAAFATVCFWASAFVGIRDAGRHISPGALTFGRVFVASVALGALTLIRREPLPARQDLPRIALFGLLWLGAYNVLLNTAEQHVDAGTAAMLVNVGPILIAILAGLLLSEGFPRNLFTGCAIAFAGAVLIGIGTSTDGLDSAVGAALCLAAAVAYAAGVIVQKPLLARNSGLTVTFLGCSVVAVASLPFAPCWRARLATPRPPRPRGQRTSGWSRRPLASRPGRTRSSAPAPDAWAPSPISCRR